MAKLGEHPGFKAVQKHIAEMQDLPMGAAGAILAKSSRGASPAAKRQNPRLKRVKGSSPTTNVSSMFKSRDRD